MEKDAEIKQNNLQNIFLQSPVLTSILTGPNFILVHTNKKILEALGRKYQDVINKPILESFPELIEQGFGQILANVYTTGKPFIISKNHVQLMRNGKLETIYVDIFYEPMRDTLENITGIICTVINLTEHSKAIKKIETSEAQFRNLIKDAEVATAIYTGKNNTILLANEAMLKLWGKDASVIGKSFNEHFPEVQWKHFHELINQTKTTGHLTQKSKEVEIALLEYGEIKSFYFNLTFKPLKNIEGNIYGILNMAIDVTEQVVAKQKILESEQRLLLANEAAQMGTFDWDLINEKFLQSQRLTQIFGFTDNKNITHQDLQEAFHPDDKPIRDKAVKNSLVAGSLNYEARVIWKDKSIHWIKCYGKVIYNAAKEPLRMYGIVMDITEQKNSFQILEESEERFKTIANTAPVMIWMSGNDKFNDFFNLSWLTFTGHTQEVEANEGWLQSLHFDDVERCKTTYQNAFKANEGFYIEYRLKRHDDVYRWVSDNVKPRYNTDGVFIGFIGACMDIDDKKSFTEKLQQRELLFKTIANASPVGLWMTDKEAKNSFVNDTWIEWTGIPYEKQLGVGWLDKVVKEDRKKVPTEFRDAMEKREKYTSQFRIIRTDGKLRWCLTEGSPYYDINGEFAGYAGSVTDITDRILIEKDLEEKVQERTAELKRSEELNFRVINEVEDHAILLLNKNGVIENWTKGAEKIIGYNRDEIIGKHFSIFYTLQDQKNFLPEKSIEDAAKFGRTSNEGWRVKKDGTVFWANVFLTALHDENNNVVGFSKVTRDLTERKAAEQQLKEKSLDLEIANIALEKSNRELEQFAYVASHDLQEPIRKIQFFVEQVQRVLPEIDESAKVYFDKIKNSTLRMNSLIKDLLDFSKLSQTNEKYTSVNLNEVLNNIVEDFELLVQQKQAIISVEVLPTIDAVPLQMQQLFYNLISNALKFSQQNVAPIITIKSNKLSPKEMEKSYPNFNANQNYYCITVKDNGIGFEEKYAEKIFVIFQRLNDFYTYGGTGIGLALCKKIVLNNNGEIFAESQENLGSCFHIILPQKQLITRMF